MRAKRGEPLARRLSHLGSSGNVKVGGPWGPAPDRVNANRVVGIDLSLSSSGVAVIQCVGDECEVTATSYTSKGQRADGLRDRYTRIQLLAAAVGEYVDAATLAVIEGPSHGSLGGSPVDRHYLWWAVVGDLLKGGIPVAVVAPATRAKFATGSGRGDKAAVAGAVSRLWPDLILANSDEADAVALAHMGAVALEWPVLTLQRHRECLPAVKWPEVKPC